MKTWTVKRITVLALLTALSFIGRFLLQPLPNVQPVTAILLIITLLMGTEDGIMVGIGSMLLSNMLLGMGPWTIYQIISYTLIILITGLMMRPFYRPNSWANRIIFATYAFILGLLYGLIISYLSVQTLGVANFWTYYLQGIPFDIMHGLGNAAFYILLEPILNKLIHRFNY